MKNKKPFTKKKKALVISLSALGALLAVLILIFGGYIIYISVQYYRIPDNQVLTINNNRNDLAMIEKEYKIMTYNIGFGAYDREFSFFMDEGITPEGKVIAGKYGKARSKEAVKTNMAGILNLSSSLNADIMLYQEVDYDADRSFHINQLAMLQAKYSNFSSIYASNFHSAYLAYPLFNNHGKTEAGLVTMSSFNVRESVRRSFTVDNSFPTKFFDLDRCFMVSRMKTNKSDKDLVVINVHLSAYDEGGKIRTKQMAELTKVLNEEYEKGNYVIVGGDYNHDVANSIGAFESTQQRAWDIHSLTNEDLPVHYSLATSSKIPTCRSCELPYKKGVNYLFIVDGFIVSDNVSVIEVNNIDTLNNKDVRFMYSDHNPVLLQFKLNN